jgi:hypothetical protein
VIINQSISRFAATVVLWAVVAMAPEAFGTWGFYDPLPPEIEAADAFWQQVYPEAGWLGLGTERVAIVVWEDRTVVEDQRLYYRISSAINAYADDVAASGLRVAVFKFYGMAEQWPPLDPPPPPEDAPGLRDRLRALYLQQPDSLAGTVIIGNVPYILAEEVIDYYGTDIHVDFPSDILLADLNGNLRDDSAGGLWRAKVFDNMADDRSTEIWVSRIVARPGLVNFVNLYCTTAPPTPATEWTQESILENYFARVAQWRWKAFNTDGKALFFSSVDAGTELQNDFADIFGPNVDYEIHETSPARPGLYLDTIAEGGYSHIHLNAVHGTEVTHVWEDSLHYVCREHYVVPGYVAGEVGVHPGCAGLPIMSFVLGTCENSEYGFFPPWLSPAVGACCWHDGTCTIESEPDCTIEGGRFIGTQFCEDCPAWRAPWPPTPAPGSPAAACMAEVLAFNPDNMTGLVALGHSKATATAAP